MASEEDPNGIKSKFNKDLDGHYPVSIYDYTKVVVLSLYWEEADHEGYRREAEEIRQMFVKNFRYLAKLFAIPTEKSQLFVDKIIADVLLEYDSETTLIIIFYGGHGDQDSGKDENKKAKKKRSIWAAKDKGGPTVNWYEIQPKLVEDSNVKSHFLILLDCCHAAQAGRGADSYAHQKRCELLAACAMGRPTPVPGTHSFTSRMMKTVSSMLAESENKEVRIRDLHTRLTKQGVVQQTPVHVYLRASEKTIRLQRFREESESLPTVEHSDEYLKLKVSVDSVIAGHSSLVKWLKTDAPPGIFRVEVEEVYYDASKLISVVLEDDISPNKGSLFEKFSDIGKTDVQNSWDSVKSCLALGTSSFGLLRTLFSTLESSVRRNLLSLPECGQVDAVESLAKNQSIQEAGLSPPLLLRQEILKSSEPGSENLQIPITKLHLVESKVLTHNRTIVCCYPSQTRFILEYKVYLGTDRYQTTGQDKLYVGRVQKLANLLNVQANANFHSLRCHKWFEDPEKSRFGLVFEIPEKHRDTEARPDTLRNIIDGSENNRLTRPTLGERFKLAYELGLAVENWHSVNWVHQSISSHNIIMFPQQSPHSADLETKPKAATPKGLESTERSQCTNWDYSAPYLGGFEYARPNCEPSVLTIVGDFEHDIYRHPARQGVPGERFHKEHDLYSFGVLLLEIGLWQSAPKLFDPKRRHKLKPTDLREKMIKNANERLPHYMGMAYTDAVRICLTGNFGVKMDDSASTILGKAFREKVVDIMSRGFILG